MGEIKVITQTEKRLDAINKLSEAVLLVAKALSTPSASVTIKDCSFSGTEDYVGISVNTQEEITKTQIEKID